MWMQYLVVKGSEIEGGIDKYETAAQGKFVVAYSSEVDVKQEDGVLYLFQGYISNREEVVDYLDSGSREDLNLFQMALSKDDFNLSRHFDGCYTAIRIEDGEINVFRDIFGSKPVYFTGGGSSIILSSNIRPILKMNPDFQVVNREVASDYLINGLADHRRETFFEGIKRLKPRETLSYNDNTFQIQRPQYTKEVSSGLKQELEENINTIKSDDEKYVCPVSGGLDSTILSTSQSILE